MRLFVLAVMSLWSNAATPSDGADPTAGLRPEQISITLSRGECMIACPIYDVEVRGDGTVTYTGRDHADVLGTHEYRVPIADVERLLDSLRAKDLWSANERYVAAITCMRTNIVTIRAGERVHRIEDYAGDEVGMPPAVREFQDEIDATAQSARWTTLTVATVEALAARGFDFTSPEGAAILWRAVVNADSRGRRASDDAIVRLLQAGARIDAAAPDGVVGYASLIEAALINRRTGVVDALVAKGALETGGSPDRTKVDAAFRAALRSGRFASVLRVWSLAGATKPALTFVDDAGPASAQTTVALLVEMNQETPGDALKTVQWLVARGTRLGGADGSGYTLLHYAAAANDVELVRYLLDRGADVSAPDRLGEPPLALTKNEDIAMLLIDAGTDLSMLRDDGKPFRTTALVQRWWRVIERLQIPR